MPSYLVSLYYRASTTVWVEAATAAEAYALACDQGHAEPFDDCSDDGYGIFQYDADNNIVGEWHDDENPIDADLSFIPAFSAPFIPPLSAIGAEKAVTGGAEKEGTLEQE